MDNELQDELRPSSCPLFWDPDNYNVMVNRLQEIEAAADTPSDVIGSPPVPATAQPMYDIFDDPIVELMDYNVLYGQLPPYFCDRPQRILGTGPMRKPGNAFSRIVLPEDLPASAQPKLTVSVHVKIRNERCKILVC
ncbi:uncharacterized protein N7482_001999 [Penicillium canariense]|uniref:Uncharacterized protein n=1 Tax=Penicillium canariense TaxID=189055 RepID=A0A9W9IGQ4_9EURO|nr:uncharacterized protein N7482_001999 [Penicillium canariense]KAJ5176122.1 hypothetical protein N7482_001999 [Penicillium canariense]